MRPCATWGHGIGLIFHFSFFFVLFLDSCFSFCSSLSFLFFLFFLPSPSFSVLLRPSPVFSCLLLASPCFSLLLLSSPLLSFSSLFFSVRFFSSSCHYHSRVSARPVRKKRVVPASESSTRQLFGNPQLSFLKERLR